jgi:hypothetical protein
VSGEAQPAGAYSAMALPPEAGAGEIPAEEPAAPGSIAAALPVGSELVQQRPEVLVGAAFAGAFLFARILKHITTSSE